MNTPARFLVALSRALSAARLYPAGHRARMAADETAFVALEQLATRDPAPVFTFLEDAVMYGGANLDDLKNWAAAERLVVGGLQRIEIRWPVARDEFALFLDAAAAAIAGRAASGPADSQSRIRFGLAAVAAAPDQADDEAPEGGALLQSRDAEIEAMAGLLQDVAESRIRRDEMQAIVGSLLLGIASSASFSLPLVRLRDADQYTTAHSLNVATLTMALAQYAGYGRDQIRAIGTAGVLHDIGKVRVPARILNKPGPLEPEERALVQQHPADGARMILESGGPGLELAAIVAYEHHMWHDGGGYPQPQRRRPCHPVSELLHVCDVYDALATHRPYRPAWEHPRILGFIEAQAGTEFAPSAARIFLEMMHSLGPRLVILESGPGNGAMPPASSLGPARTPSGAS
jgi:putative nucleotidyltransferase with HDIG domain